MFSPRSLLALGLGLGLGTFVFIGQARAATNVYVCEISLGVSEERSPSGSWGSPASFSVSLSTQPFCGGTALPGAAVSMNGPHAQLANDYDSVLRAATVEYDNSALMGAFMKLQTAAALGLKVGQIQSSGDDELAMKFEGLTISNVPGGSRPLGETTGGAVWTTHRGYVCRSEQNMAVTHSATMAAGHRMKMTLTAGPGCTGGTLYQGDLLPQTVSALPRKIRNLAYEQARQQQFNLATVALGHAVMMAEVGRMFVEVRENTQTGALSSMSFRAIPLNTCKVTNKIPKTRWVPPKRKIDWVTRDRLPKVEKKSTPRKTQRQP